MRPDTTHAAACAWLDGRPLPLNPPGLPPPDPCFDGPGASLFESLRIGPDAPPGEFRAHLGRLRDSARLLGRPWPAALDGWAPPDAPAPAVLRLSLSPAGRWRAWISPPPAPAPVRLHLHAPLPLALPPAVKHHARQPWERREREVGGELLFCDEGFLLETSRASIFACSDGAWLTPPLDGRILPGCTRARLIREWRADGTPVREAPLPLAVALSPGVTLWIASALRGLRRVDALADAATAPPPAASARGA